MKSEEHDLAKADRTEVQTPTARLQVTHSQIHVGPLPPPEQLAKYNDAVPNGAERIFAMVEKQITHRQGLETAAVEAEIKRSFRGLAVGFATTTLALFVSAVLIYNGHDFAGASLFGVSLVAVVVAFVSGSAMQKKLDNRLKIRQQPDRNE
ncbi:MAG: DUF2335 domain-containing protein [candidate division KSB1 bacterium]